MQRLSKLNSELQKQLAASSEQLQNLKKAKNITRKFSSAVRMVKNFDKKIIADHQNLIFHPSCFRESCHLLENEAEGAISNRPSLADITQVKQQKDNDVTQKIIKKLEEDSEQYTDRFNILDNEVSHVFV